MKLEESIQDSKRPVEELKIEAQAGPEADTAMIEADLFKLGVDLEAFKQSEEKSAVYAGDAEGADEDGDATHYDTEGMKEQTHETESISSDSAAATTNKPLLGGVRGFESDTAAGKVTDGARSSFVSKNEGTIEKCTEKKSDGEDRSGDTDLNNPDKQFEQNEQETQKRFEKQNKGYGTDQHGG